MRGEERERGQERREEQSKEVRSSRRWRTDKLSTNRPPKEREDALNKRSSGSLPRIFAAVKEGWFWSIWNWSKLTSTRAWRAARGELGIQEE